MPYSEQVSIKKIFEEDLLKLTKEEESLKNVGIPHDLQSRIDSHKKNLKKFRDEIHLKKVKVDSFYAIEKRKIQAEIDAYRSSYAKRSGIPKDIFDKYIKPLQDQIDAVNQKKDHLCLNITNRYDAIHNSLINDLKARNPALNDDFKRVNKETSEKLIRLYNRYNLKLKKNSSERREKYSTFRSLAKPIVDRHLPASLGIVIQPTYSR